MSRFWLLQLGLIQSRIIKLRLRQKHYSAKKVCLPFLTVIAVKPRIQMAARSAAICILGFMS